MSDILDQIGQFGTATIHEAMGRRGALPCDIAPIATGQTIVGRAVTAECQPRDNAALLAALSIAGEGDVLVVATGGHREAGYFGEVLATACQARGVAGLVIDGGVRDTAELRAMGFAVYAARTCIQGTVKATLGAVQTPIAIGGQVIRPGDYVRGDDDGVVIIAPEDAEAAVQASRAREDKESQIMQRMREGTPPLVALGQDTLLRDLGFRAECFSEDRT